MSLPKYPNNDVINDVKLDFSRSRGNTLEVMVGLMETQTGGRQPSLWAFCGWASTQRCQTLSQAPTASPCSEWLAGSSSGFKSSSLCPQPDTAHTYPSLSELRPQQYHIIHLCPYRSFYLSYLSLLELPALLFSGQNNWMCSQLEDTVYKHAFI